MPYLDRDAFANLTTMPLEFIMDIEAVSPGWIDRNLAVLEAKINARLRKQYAVPFASPAPLIVQGWLTSMMTHRCYIRRGLDPNDLQMVDVKAEADSAWAEVLEAANAQDGLFELPLRADQPGSGISKQQTRAYVERSPYVSADREREAGRDEDRQHEGTYR